MVSKIFYFHPYLGKIPILTNIFQMGWNHQLGIFGCKKLRQLETGQYHGGPDLGEGTSVFDRLCQGLTLCATVRETEQE